MDAVAAHEADVVGGEDAGFGNGDARLNPLPFEGLRTGRCGEAPPPPAYPMRVRAGWGGGDAAQLQSQAAGRPQSAG